MGMVCPEDAGVTVETFVQGDFPQDAETADAIFVVEEPSLVNARRWMLCGRHG